MLTNLPLFGNNIKKDLSVLLIDDNPNFLHLINHLLQQQNNVQVVGTANCGEKGLTKALSLRPDMILMGLSLPDIYEIEGLIHRLRLHLPETDIIIMVLTESLYYRKVARNAGANYFVLKHTLIVSLLGVDKLTYLKVD